MYKKKQFFNNLNPKFVSDNKLFWKIVKPLFFSKVSYNANIKLIDKDEIIQSDQKVAETLDRFFKNFVFSSKLNENTFIINSKRKTFRIRLKRLF